MTAFTAQVVPSSTSPRTTAIPMRGSWSGVLFSRRWGCLVRHSPPCGDPPFSSLPRLAYQPLGFQYLLRVNDAGAEPPAETGLLCNSWGGKHHNEMRVCGCVHLQVAPPSTAHRRHFPSSAGDSGIRLTGLSGATRSSSPAQMPSSSTSSKMRRPLPLRRSRATLARTGPRRPPLLSIAGVMLAKPLLNPLLNSKRWLHALVQ